MEIFNTFVKNSKDKILLNADCNYFKDIEKTKNTITFGINNNASYTATNIDLAPLSATFLIKDVKFKINLAGIHNVYNALAAISALNILGISLKDISDSLINFKGMHRRFEIVKQTDNVTVIDDFGHNPAKIEATLKTVKKVGKRVIAFYQPHGFGPTKFMRNDYIAVFSKYLDKSDFLFMPEIFYQGGTASKDISSADLINEIAKTVPNSFFIDSRDQIKESIIKNLKRGDTIIVMGARDNSLTTFCLDIAKDADLAF